MELPSKIIEQIPYNTRLKIEERMLIVLDESTHEEPLSQFLQTNNKQFQIAITFLPGYNGIFSVTNKNSKSIFISIFEGAEYNVITIPPGAYGIESLNKEIKRYIIDERYVTEGDYPFTIKPNSTTVH